MAKIVLRLTPYERATLKIVLEEEIDRNGAEFEDINEACRKILRQIAKGVIA